MRQDDSSDQLTSSNQRRNVDHNTDTHTLESVASSIDMAEKTHWDSIIIGAGPAGSLAATLLARRGLRTLLIERKSFPRYKVCGACLNPLSLSLLKTARLEHTFRDAVPLNRFWLQSRGRALKLNLPGSVSISRERFDERLAQAAVEAGARFISGCVAKVVPLETDNDLKVVSPAMREIELTAENGQCCKVTTNSVVAADGLTHSSLSRLNEFSTDLYPSSRLGAGTVVTVPDRFYEPGCIYMSSGRDGYVGLVRLEDGKLNIAAALDAAAIDRCGSLAVTALDVIRSAGFPVVAELQNADWQGTPALTRSTRPLSSHRIVLVGDAAGYVEPFTGEGIAWALASATSVVPLILCAVQRWDSLLERTWNANWYRDVGYHQRWCHRLSRLLRHPMAVSALTRVVATCPWLTAPVLRHLNRISRVPADFPLNSLTVQKTANQGRYDGQ